VSLEDELMQRFGGDRIKTVMSWTGLEEETPVENRLITKSIGGAQVKVESYHFDIRKHLLDYDDVLNKQREIIYDDRHEVLDGGDVKEKFLAMLRQELESLIRTYLPDRHADNWNAAGFIDELGQICDPPSELADEEQIYEWSLEQIAQILSDYAKSTYDAREEEIGSDQMRTIERLLLLRAIDTHWVQHLTALENLRTGIGLQAYGQRDPLVMYRTEGHKMFQNLMARIQHDVTHTVFHVTLNQQPAGGRRARRAASNESPMKAVNDPNRGAAPTGGSSKVGRNAQCPCGSGKKYKRCHGAAA
jgi:preprotein translocase subunit SecA